MNSVLRSALLACVIAIAPAIKTDAANLSRDYWKNITGTTVASLTSNPAYPASPTGTDALTALEGPQNWGDNYGARVRGYLVAPATGNYTFWISGDDQGQFFLSTTDLPANKAILCQFTAATSYRQWTKYANQQSKAIALTQGKRYYFEVLHKEGAGSDNFSVGWKLPSGTLERPIPNSRLQPFETVSITATLAQIAEGSSAKSAFLITRTGSLTKALAVTLTPGGAAQWGADYLLADLSGSTAILKSKLFTGDNDALAIANGQTTVVIPLTHGGTMEEYQAIDSWWRIKWKIARAYHMLGYEAKAFPFGKTIGSAELINLDAKVYAMEKILLAQSARFGNFRDIAGPDFWNNLSEDFVGGNIATLLDLFNAGATKYQSVTNDCVLANYIPHMCGQLQNFGTTTGGSCTSPDIMLPLAQLKIQSPDMFGYSNRRDIVGANEVPSYALTSPSNTWLTLTHEFVHDLDTFLQNSGYNNMVKDRTTVCSANLMEFLAAGSPFNFTGAPGSQKTGDFVSAYAAGLINAAQDYRSWEDAAETMTAYMLLPEYFRYWAAKSAVLKAKYDYVKNTIFGGKEFENLDFASATSFAWLNATTGNIDALTPDRFSLSDIRVKGSAAKTLTVTLPAGVAQFRLEFLPLDEKLVEPAEAATLSISASSTYQKVAPTSATITIANDD